MSFLPLSDALIGRDLSNVSLFVSSIFSSILDSPSLSDPRNTCKLFDETFPITRGTSQLILMFWPSLRGPLGSSKIRIPFTVKSNGQTLYHRHLHMTSNFQ